MLDTGEHPDGVKTQRMALSRQFRSFTLIAALATMLCVAAGAAAADGGSVPGQQAAADPSRTGGAGAAKKSMKSTKAKKAKKRVSRTPVLAAYRLDTSLNRHNVIKLRYRIMAPARRVRVRAIVRTRGGKYVKTLELGVHSTNALVIHALSAGEVGVKRGGDYKIRITARDGRKRAAKRARKVPAWRPFRFNASDYHFPVAGRFSYGGDGARFGSGRSGHTHQGQDLVADAGTPVVAPYAGKISHVAHQAGGAGYYVVMSADDSRDYVFMHLLKNSTAVKLGDRVKAGQQLGLVGSTGASTGPHLHFEVWTGGPWQFGGRPIDPLPLLKSWQRGDPAGAARISTLARSASASAGAALHPPHPHPFD